MAKVKETARVICQEQLAEGVYSMWLDTTTISAQALPGQFISLYSHDGSRLLPRPISLCEIDPEGEAVRIVYRVAGKGTEEFSHYDAEDMVDILGPLGNGFPIKAAEGKKILLMGGGIGIPPMLAAFQAVKGEKATVLGYRDSQMFLKNEFEELGKVYVATEDGSFGTKGNVLDAVRENRLEAEMIFACGPTPMLRAIKDYAAQKGIVCYLSLEEKMACGIGACLACVCQSKEMDEHSHVHNKRVCKDGPVFLAEEVEI